MSQHKWHKEIKAWADGAEIEYKDSKGEWRHAEAPYWHNELEYRIKPQPKEPQYLYVWHEPNYGKSYLTGNTSVHSIPAGYEYLGKIKLEEELE
jgi:hypothetical protein